MKVTTCISRNAMKFGTTIAGKRGGFEGDDDVVAALGCRFSAYK